MHSRLDDQFPALKSQDNQSVEERTQNHPNGVQNVSWHSLEDQKLSGEDYLVTILRPKDQNSDVTEKIVEGQNIINQDKHKQENAFEEVNSVNQNKEEENKFEEETVHENGYDKSDSHLKVNVSTKTESDIDSKNNVQKAEILETIGEEYYLYDDH